MVVDTHHHQRTRHSSRVHEVKMESDVNDVNTPRTPFPFSRGQTPNGKATRRGNNRYGNKGTNKCVRCREQKKPCKYDRDNPESTCELCASKGYPCGIKVKSEQQAQIKVQVQGDSKGLNAQRQFQWNETDNFLDNVIYLARNNLLPENVAAKLADEINLYFQGKGQSLPAPQVPGYDLPGYALLQDAGPVPILPPQNNWGQAGLGYAPQPTQHSVRGNQLTMRSPIGTPQPITQELHHGIPRLPTDTQLTTAPPQALDTPAPDWREHNATFGWDNELYPAQEFNTLYSIERNNTGTPQDVPMQNWDNYNGSGLI